MAKIFYKVLSWGLGHATRSLPIIRKLVELKHDVTVSSSGRALELLKLELGNSCTFMEIPDIFCSFLRDYHYLLLLPKAVIEIPRFFKLVQREHELVENVLDELQFNLVLSDSCYGAYSHKIPCYFLSHHLKPFWFWKVQSLQQFNEKILSRLINRFDKILIPDYPGSPLSGLLSTNFRYIDEKKVHYVGILSDYKRRDVPKDIDYLILISGHEPQRTSFQNIIMKQLEYLWGKIVICLGKPEKLGKCFSQNGKEICGFLTKQERDLLMNRSKFIISRPGYSTLMDIIETRLKSGLFIPTPNQTEQEYLAEFHHRRGNFWAVKQKKLCLKENIKEARKLQIFKGFQHFGTEHTVENILKIVFEEKSG